MSDTNNFETGYQDDNDNTMGPNNTGAGNGNANASTGFGAPTSKGKPAGKKGSKLPLIIFGVLAVAGIGAGAYFMLGGNPPPPPAPTVATPAADPAVDGLGADVDPNAVDPTLSAGSQIDPITGLPVTDPAMVGSPAIDPITGLPVTDSGAAMGVDPSTLTPDAGGMPVDPITGLPISDPAQAGAFPGQAPQNLDPITGLPISDPSMSDPAMPGQTMDPGLQAPTQAVPVQSNPVQDPRQVAPVAPVSTSPVAGDPLAQFRDMLAPIDGRVTTLENQVTTLNTRVDDISGRVDRLMDRPRNDNSINVAPAPRRQARASTPARKKPAPRPNNYVRVSESPRVAPPVSRVVIVTQGSAAHEAMVNDGVAPVGQNSAPSASVRSVSSSAEVRNVPAADPSCNLQAIVPGRAWVKNADGSFASYGEGDSWNGQTVGSIDPSRGVKVGDRWICN